MLVDRLRRGIHSRREDRAVKQRVFCLSKADDAVLKAKAVFMSGDYTVVDLWQGFGVTAAKREDRPAKRLAALQNRSERKLCDGQGKRPESREDSRG